MADHNQQINNTGGWGSHKLLVMNQLDRLEKRSEDIDKKLTKMLVEMTVIKTKAGLLGLMAGAIPAIIGVIVVFMKGSK